MLRITPVQIRGSTTLKLEGKLVGPWLGELRDACEQYESASGKPTLDLTHLTYADAPGSELLLELGRRGVCIVACSNFVAQLLNLEKP